MPTLVESRSRPRWESRKDARPQELLAAALDLFVERGYAATRLDEVAARAGVSKGTLYLYFENKEELFKAVVRENMVPPREHGRSGWDTPECTRSSEWGVGGAGSRRGRMNISKYTAATSEWVPLGRRAHSRLYGDY